ncbi:DUF4760 domain-containing protein [Dactylosporangium sp. NBC_01737]|uniref:DUF4760 domain-containing protein n=1 Tax=Dactylosporangium sp. NBC_01737 TaxID=2975959 RepID=UPI002E0EACFA|nr:DUF4760 domain-containing protein [Dactylosporangium sp. NBC_01737]
MSPFEWVTTALGVATLVIGIGSLLFVGVQLRQGAKETRKAAFAEEEERARQRKRETIDAVAKTARYRQELKAALPWNDRDAASVKRFLEEAENDPKTKAAIRAYLDYLEMLAVGANEGVLDVDTLARIHGGRIVAIATNYAEYIDRRREELGTTTLYSEIGALADAIRASPNAPRQAVRPNEPSVR